MKNLSSKKGVALITVLMFMLIATIAATATYKWLSSHNTLSGSRMMQSEAYQAAKAGIDNAKNWMTFNGNDVGALIYQFEKGNGAPVALNQVLKPLNSRKQNFDVHLVAVDVSNSNYKLKIISTGYSSGGSEHREVAVLNVSGLYRVKLPVPRRTATSNYKFSYFGSDLKYEGSKKMTSIAVNGDWNGNPPETEMDFIVTGNATLSGNEFKSGKKEGVEALGNVCIGGDLAAHNGINVTNIYVAGNATDMPTGLVSGDAYFNGNVTFTGAGSGVNAAEMKFEKSVTFNGTTNFTLGEKPARIKGNLCATNNSTLIFNGDQKELNAEGNVAIDGYMKPTGTLNARHSGDKEFIARENIVTSRKLGSRKESLVYVKGSSQYGEWTHYTTMCDNVLTNNCGQVSNFTHHNEGTNKWPSPPDPFKYYSAFAGYKTDINATYHYYKDNCYEGDVRECSSKDYWGNCTQYYCTRNTFNLNVHTSFVSKGTVSTTNPGITCSSDPKTYCENTWVSESNCGANYKINDPLQLSYDDFKNYAINSKYATGQCRTLGDDVRFSDETIATLNSCYNELVSINSDYLYGGSYLVVNVKPNDQLKGYSAKLTGKFVLIFEDAVSGQKNIPNTDPEAMILVYFRGGVSNLTLQANPGGLTTVNRYFFFTEKKVDSPCWSANPKDCSDINFLNSGTIKGSFYSKADACIRGNMNGGSTIEFDQELLDDLTSTGILCPNDGSLCGAGHVTPTSSSEEESSDDVVESRDAYYIAIGPQLNVSIESEYKNSEQYDGTPSELDGSIIVLPRIIYLTRDPIGTLSDYYNVINLNGATETKTPSKVTCTGIPPTGSLYEGTDYLSEGLHRCSYTSQEYGTIPFYVNVKGLTATTPLVGFNREGVILEPGSDDPSRTRTVVSLDVPEASGNQEMSVDVLASKEPSSWNFITPSENISFLKDLGSEGKLYRVKISTIGTIPLFTYDLNGVSSTESGSVTYQLMDPCDGCSITRYSMETVTITGRIAIERHGLSEYCELHSDYCASETIDSYTLQQISNRPDCENSSVWVNVNGVNCSVLDATYPNNGWSCSNEGNVRLVPVSSSNPYCEVVIPSENNEISGVSDTKTTQILYGSLKKKPVELTINLLGTKGGEKVHVQKLEGSEWVDMYEPLTESGTVIVYAGDQYQLLEEHGSNRFSYWSCNAGNCGIDEGIQAESINITISSSVAIDAHFNEKDKHCFYEDFQELDKRCKNGALDDEECIDKCGNRLTAGESCDLRAGKYGEKNWILVYSNKVNGSGNQNGNFVEIVNGSIGRPNYHGNSDYEHGGLTDKHNGASGAPTVIMNHVEAGYDGVMTSIFTTEVLCHDKHDYRKESGFIFRSNANASAYYSLHIYGETDDSKCSQLVYANGISSRMWAKICQVSGQTVTDPAAQCVIQELNAKKLPLNYFNVKPINGKTAAKLVLEADISGSTVKVNVKPSWSMKSSDDELETTFDLSDPKFSQGLFNDLDHQYVGFKLAAENFRLYDLGWSTTTPSYENQGCFSNPTLKCNFSQNYTDGRVPINTDVSPWYTTSAFSIATYNECKIDFYYNGCDNTTSNNNCAPGSKGSFDEDGVVLNNSNGTYNFTMEGLHGYPAEETDLSGTRRGTAYDAKVKISCSNPNLEIPSSLYKAKSCGTFYVGASIPCSENAVLVNEVEYCYSSLCEVELANTVNLRSASVALAFEDGYFDGTIAFKDSRGNESKVTSISQANQVIDLENVKDLLFDPQSVKYLVIRPSENATVRLTEVHSICPNAMNIGNCQASYNSRTWTFKADVLNGDECLIENADGAATSHAHESENAWSVDGNKWVNCSAGLNLAGVEDLDKIESVKNYKFRFTVRKAADQTKTETCETGIVTVAPSSLSSSSPESSGDAESSASEDIESSSSVQMTANCSFESTPVTVGSNATLNVSNVANGSGNTVTVYDAHGTKVSDQMSRSDNSNFSISFATTNTHGETTYYLYDANNNTVCQANLTVNEVPSSSSVASSSSTGCHCTCSQGCDNLNASGTTIEGTTYSVACLFGTSISTINGNHDRNDIKVNGTVVKYCDNGGCNDSWRSTYNIKPVDGGYYVEVPISNGCNKPAAGQNNDCTWLKAAVGGSSTPVCGSGSGTSSSAVSSSSTVSSSSVSSSSSSVSGSMCSPGATVKTYECSTSNSGNFDTKGAVCVKIHGGFGGGGLSNESGRKLRINGGSWGTSMSGADATSDGYVYVDISAGDYDYASIYWYNCK